MLHGLFLRANGALFQQTQRRLLAGGTQQRGAHFVRRHPGGIVVVLLVPTPGIQLRVKFLIGGQGVVAGTLIARQGLRGVGLVGQAFPVAIGVHRGAVALKNEPRLERNLRHGLIRPVVPDHGGEHVLPRPQLRSEVHCLVSPMLQVAARRTQADEFAIDV